MGLGNSQNIVMGQLTPMVQCGSSVLRKAFGVKALNRGGPEQPVIFAELSDWTKHADPAVKYYSGTAFYRKTFDCGAPIPKATAFLSLGTIKNVAEVRLNGLPLGIVWCAPWQVTIPTGLLKEKGNDLEIEVVNLWPNRMIGDEQLPDDCEFSGGVWNLMKSYPDWFKNKQPRPGGRVGFANMRCWEKDSPLLTSGLPGPVRVMVE